MTSRAARLPLLSFPVNSDLTPTNLRAVSTAFRSTTLPTLSTTSEFPPKPPARMSSSAPIQSGLAAPPCQLATSSLIRVNSALASRFSITRIPVSSSSPQGLPEKLPRSPLEEPSSQPLLTSRPKLTASILTHWTSRRITLLHWRSTVVRLFMIMSSTTIRLRLT